MVISKEAQRRMDDRYADIFREITQSVVDGIAVSETDEALARSVLCHVMEAYKRGFKDGQSWTKNFPRDQHPVFNDEANHG